MKWMDEVVAKWFFINKKLCCRFSLTLIHSSGRKWKHSPTETFISIWNDYLPDNFWIDSQSIFTVSGIVPLSIALTKIRTFGFMDKMNGKTYEFVTVLQHHIASSTIQLQTDAHSISSHGVGDTFDIVIQWLNSTARLITLVDLHCPTSHLHREVMLLDKACLLIFVMRLGRQNNLWEQVFANEVCFVGMLTHCLSSTSRQGHLFWKSLWSDEMKEGPRCVMVIICSNQSLFFNFIASWNRNSFRLLRLKVKKIPTSFMV